jgi:hypothetical protein
MRQDINTVAKQELNEALSHGSTAKEAAASLAARCRQDPELYHQLMDPLLMDACRRVIEQVTRQSA